MEKEALDIETLLARLDQLAAEDFPTQRTHRFLQETTVAKEAMEPYIHYTSDNYTRNLVHKSKDYELLFICWGPGHCAPVHGHEGEKCWARVEQGKLFFTNYQEIPKGDSFEMKLLLTEEGGVGYLDGPADIHKVENNNSEPAISLHLYSKPYDACDVYDLEKGQKMRKTMRYFSQFGEVAVTQ